MMMVTQYEIFLRKNVEFDWRLENFDFCKIVLIFPVILKYTNLEKSVKPDVDRFVAIMLRD